jgi:hypothetical protein
MCSGALITHVFWNTQLRAQIPHVLSHPVQCITILLTKSQRTAKNCKKIATYFHEILLRRDLLGGSCGALPKYEARHNSHAAFRAEVNFVITEILQLAKNISVAIALRRLISLN